MENFNKELRFLIYNNLRVQELDKMLGELEMLNYAVFADMEDEINDLLLDKTKEEREAYNVTFLKYDEKIKKYHEMISTYNKSAHVAFFLKEGSKSSKAFYDFKDILEELEVIVRQNYSLKVKEAIKHGSSPTTINELERIASTYKVNKKDFIDGVISNEADLVISNEYYQDAKNITIIVKKV